MQTFKEYIETQPTITVDHQQDRYTIYLKNGKSIVGKLTIQIKFDKRFNWLTSFYIDPPYRNKGYARKMFNIAKSKSIKDILLRAYPYKDENKNTDQLIRMYKNLGFEEYTESGLKYYMVYRI